MNTQYFLLDQWDIFYTDNCVLGQKLKSKNVAGSMSDNNNTIH